MKKELGAMYPYIPAPWLSPCVGEFEPGKKRTMLGWMSEKEMEMTGIREHVVGTPHQAVPVVEAESISESGGHVALAPGMRIWERAKRRQKDIRMHEIGVGRQEQQQRIESLKEVEPPAEDVTNFDDVKGLF